MRIASDGIVLLAGIFVGIAIGYLLGKPPIKDHVARIIHQERLYDGKECLISRLNIRDSTGPTQLIIVEGKTERGRTDYPKCRVILP